MIAVAPPVAPVAAVSAASGGAEPAGAVRLRIDHVRRYIFDLE